MKFSNIDLFADSSSNDIFWRGIFVKNEKLMSEKSVGNLIKNGLSGCFKGNIKFIGMNVGLDPLFMKIFLVIKLSNTYDSLDNETEMFK